MEENEFFTEPLTEEPPINEEPVLPEKPKNKYKAVSIIFKIVAVLIFLSSIACGIAFGYTEQTILVPYGGIDGPFFDTERVFELWRAVLFGIVGFSNGLCLFAISEIFRIIGKKKK